GDRRPIKDWILSGWDQPSTEVEQLVMDAASAVELIVDQGVRAAMQQVNTGGAGPA
ncbi:MAG: hypothetical protein H7287_13535, partial [Thermoleophilia bacterium]|nr:hypothetical protein [Thermoleophilia bacterium]